MKKQYKLAIVLCGISYSALSCDLNNTQPISTEIPSLLNDTRPRQVLVSNNVKSGLESPAATLLMHNADNLMLIDSIDSWQVLDEPVDSIVADPVAVDFNYDGVADALYVVNRVGLLWFIRVTASGFATPKLIADFRSSGYSFEQPLQLVQFSNGGKGGMQNRQVMLLLVAQTIRDGDVLMALHHQEFDSSTISFNDLTDRTSISNDEQRYGVDEAVWQQIQQGAGWYIHLERRVINAPKVYAGVVYFSAAVTSDVHADCTVAENSEQQLYAVHLHHAGLVYAKRNWIIEPIAKPELTVFINDKAQLQLMLQNDQKQVTVVDTMLTINELCVDCVEELDAGKFPHIIRLATFQSEAY